MFPNTCVHEKKKHIFPYLAHYDC